MREQCVPTNIASNSYVCHVNASQSYSNSHSKSSQHTYTSKKTYSLLKTSDSHDINLIAAKIYTVGEQRAPIPTLEVSLISIPNPPSTRQKHESKKHILFCTNFK